MKRLIISLVLLSVTVCALSSWYHTYTVTPGSRVHYFNYGGGVSIQPLKWFSINFAYTRHAIYGGLAIDIDALAFRH